MRSIPCLYLFLFVFISCSADKKSGNVVDGNVVVQSLINDIVISPGKKFPKGTVCQISVSTSNKAKPDSVVLYCNNKLIGTLLNINEISFIASDVNMGNNSIVAQSFLNGQKQNLISTDIYVVSDRVPETYTYKIINTFKHDKASYTQGLLYDNGKLYESGGQYGESTLRLVDLKTGNVEKSINLSPSIFAEGLALYNDKLFQLSWREQTLFVYDKKTFTQIQKISYPIAEGWGLTFNGNNFLMTDGTNYVYVMEPSGFTQINKIEVCDNNGPVKLLNELEYVNGLVYANIYTTNNIAIFNAKTGEVTGLIDFSGLLKKEDYHATIDVLNGIAYNSENGHFFITGKYWPKLFEVEIVKK